MPPAPRSVVRALLIGVGENRTTALLAVACQLHDPFAEALIRSAVGDPRLDVEALEGVRVEVLTAAGRRVDLEIAVRTASGGLSRLWFEAKWDAAWQSNQLEHYAEALTTLAGAQDHRLIVLLPAARAPDLARFGLGTRIAPLTWEQLAVVADRSGAATHAHSGGTGPWRRAARESDAPARQHVLDQLLEHLKEDHDVVIDQLTTSHASALSLAKPAIDISDQLMREALGRSELNGRDGNTWSHALGRRWIVETGPSVPIPWASPEGHFEAFRSVSGKHHEAAGAVYIAGVRLPQLAAERLSEIIGQVCTHDGETDWPWSLTQLAEGTDRYVCSVLPVEAVATAAGTFDGQVDFLGRWLQRTITALNKTAVSIDRDVDDEVL